MTMFNGRSADSSRYSIFAIRYFGGEGFTLIEMLVVIASLGILVVMGISSFVGFNEREAVEQEAGKIISRITEARTLTLSAKDGEVYGIHFAPDAITLFQGTSYDENAVTNQVQTVNNAVRISSISLTGGGDDVVFKKLTGETDQAGTVTLSSVRGGSDTKDIVITGAGSVYTNQ